MQDMTADLPKQAQTNVSTLAVPGMGCTGNTTVVKYDTATFLARVVPSGNYLNLAINKNPAIIEGEWTQRTYVVSDYAKAANAAIWHASQGRDVYFAHATFNLAQTRVSKQGKQFLHAERKQPNVQWLRALVIDGDVKRDGDGKDPAKVFTDRGEAMAWLAKFAQATGLPQPNLVVNSGYGFHWYWLLDTPLPPREWQLFADAMKAAMAAHKFPADTAITVDSARLLRPAGCVNMKSGQPVPVEVLDELTCADYPNAQIEAALKPWISTAAQQIRVAAGGATFTQLGQRPAHIADQPALNLNAAAMQNIERCNHSFEQIAKQCQQVSMSLAAHGNGDQYQLWYLGHLTLAHFCADGADFVHPISDGDPRYVPAETDRMVARIANEVQTKGRGAPKCSSYDSYRPGVCGKCPFFGRVSSPFSLGVTANPQPVVAAAQPLASFGFFTPVKLNPADLRGVEWLVENMLLQGAATVLAGQGGAAKTVFGIHLAVACASGRGKLGPIKIRTRPRGLRVAVISAEEDKNRIALLVAAACNVLGLTATERAAVEANLFVHDAQESGWRLGEPRPNHREDIAPEGQDDRATELCNALAGMDVLILDTLAALFALPSELDNTAATRLMRRLGRIAGTMGCAVLLIHHTPKLTREAAAAQRGEATLVRGGGAIANSARVVLSLTGLPIVEAAQFAVQGLNPDRVRRLEHVKINDGPSMDPAYFAITQSLVRVHDGSDQAVRAVEFLQPLPAGGNAIPDKIRNIAMRAIDAGARDDHGRRVPLSPGGGRQNTRDAVSAIANALQQTDSTLSDVHARAAARDVLKDLKDNLGCVVEQDVQLPRYKPDGQPNGTRAARGLVCRWDLAPWMPHSPPTPQQAGDTPATPDAASAITATTPDGHADNGGQDVS